MEKIDRVNIRLRINGKRIKSLCQFGVRIKDRDEEGQTSIVDGHKAHRGIEWYFRSGERVNAAGETLGGSGITRIEFNKPKRITEEAIEGKDEKVTWQAGETRAMKLESIGKDLATAGYYLSDVHIVRLPSETKGMGFLVISFTQDGDLGLNSEIEEILNGLVDGFWRSAWVYENIFTGAVDICANHIVRDENLSLVKDHRDLRFRRMDGGRTQWRSAKTTAQTA